MNVKASFQFVKWDEQTYEPISDSQKLTKATAEFKSTGGIEGNVKTEYLMVYTKINVKEPMNSLGYYTGLSRIEGKINGKMGSFVLEEKGMFDAGRTESILTIVKGSGTGDFAGITGTGNHTASHGASAVDLHYSLST